MRDGKLQEIKGIELFGGLGPQEARWVARHADIVEVPEGHTFSRRGDKAHEFIVVVDGLATVSGPGREHVLAPGAWFGAIEMITGRPFARTIRARTPIRVLVVSQRAFVPMLDAVPGLARHLFHGVAAKLTSQAQYAEAS